MKKMIAVTMMVLAAVVMAGCATVQEGRTEEKPIFSGDLPKTGEIIRVLKVIGHETATQYQYDVVWSYYREEAASEHVCSALGGKFTGLNNPGTYAVANGGKGNLWFVEDK